MTASQKTVCLVAVAAAASGIYHWAGTITRERAELDAERKRSAQIEAQIPRARQLRDEAQHDAALLQQAIASARTNSTAGGVGDDSAAITATKAWRQRVDRLKQLLAARPDWQIPELKLLNDQDWLEIAQSAQLETEADIRRSLIALLADAKAKFATVVQVALRKYIDSSGGELPSNVLQLAPLCAPTVDPAMLARYAMIRTGKAGPINEPLIAENPSPTTERQGKLSIGLYSTQTETALTSIALDLSGNGGLQSPTTPSQSTGTLDVPPAVSTELQDMLAQAAEAYARAHHGDMPANLNAEELRPYVKDPAKLEALMRTLKSEIEKHP